MKMYLLLKMVIFHPVMLVFRGISISIKAAQISPGFSEIVRMRDVQLDCPGKTSSEVKDVMIGNLVLQWSTGVLLKIFIHTREN